MAPKHSLIKITYIASLLYVQFSIQIQKKRLSEKCFNVVEEEEICKVN